MIRRTNETVRRWGRLSLLLVMAACASSCLQSLRSEASRRYPGIHLPETRWHRHEDRGIVIAVSIRRNGEIHIARQRIDPSDLDGLMSPIHLQESYISIDIGADVATPFDAVWPVVQTCRSNNIGFVSFVARNRGFDSMVTHMVLLPLWENDPTGQSPLLIKEGACPTTLGIATNGFVLNGVPYDEPGLQAALEKLCKDKGSTETVLIIPDPGILHRDFMAALLMCGELGLENTCLIEPGRAVPPAAN